MNVVVDRRHAMDDPRGAECVARSAGSGSADLGDRAPTSSPPVVVVVGPPGAGKGTQCRRLAQGMGLAHLSVGDSLRAEISHASRLGARVRPFVESGALVPDALVVHVALRRLDQHVDGRGVLFDGFPRTVGQAEALEAVRPGVVRLCVVLVVPRERLLERLMDRGRHDDRAEVIRKRLLSYERDTKPLLGWYANQGIARYVDGNAAPERVTESLQRLVLEAGVPDPASVGSAALMRGAFGSYPEVAR